jgi:protein-S-isoprenylcysteine O-methyltransferase Ste14
MSKSTRLTIAMTNADSAHKSYWEISEVVFGIPFLLGIALQLIVPFSLHSGILRLALIPVGIALIIIGIGFIVLARREFAQYSQSMEPGHPISKVVNTGVFSISRNPLYLGIVNALSGIALVLNILWVLILLIPAIILCHYILIAPEERYLENKFGKEYLVYATSVRRWLGRK